MAQYTIELREIINQGIELPLNDYPIFNEDYRDLLNWKIVNHFLMREIGYETVDLFLIKLRLQMYVIMPKMNLLYEAFENIDDILTNLTQTEEYSGKILSTSSDISNTQKHDNNVGFTSETPTTIIKLDDIDTGVYANNIVKDNNHSDITGNNLANSDMDNVYTRKLSGRNVSVVSAINETIGLISIDTMLFDELETLFMQIY